ncbi:MAG: SGNH/GDSL hydrolase family protein, partial [Planctomycetaceae bacterium]|nr:SGNH/GDSL hydrolase family protein [Planctomycetaceae bacterium]
MKTPLLSILLSGLSCALPSAIQITHANDETPASAEHTPWHLKPELVQPFWVGDTVYGESVLFLADADRPASASLMFPPTEVLAVTSSDGATKFESGRDYLLDGKDQPGRLILTPDSRIPAFQQQDLRRAPGSQKYRLTHRDGNGEILFGGQLEYHAMQVTVTYRHAVAPLTFPVPAFDGAALPRSINQLRQKDPLSIVVLGDSISSGCNASGWGGGAPFQPAYPELLPLILERYSGAKVSLTNLSVGGMSTPWGITMADQVAATEPDLVVIAFGMNDATGRPAAEYKANTQAMMEAIRGKRPQAEFILVATMRGNSDWTLLKPELFGQFRDALLELKQPGVAVADLTSIWDAFLQQKNDSDLTGNG